MKISNIIIVVLAALVLVIMLSLVGVTVAPLAFLVFGIPIALFAYLLILAKRYVDAKVQESKTSTGTSADLNAKITVLSESLDRIEKKVEKIERILEKVSD